MIELADFRTSTGDLCGRAAVTGVMAGALGAARGTVLVFVMVEPMIIGGSFGADFRRFAAGGTVSVCVPMLSPLGVVSRFRL